MDGLQSQCGGLQSTIVLECKVQISSSLVLTNVFFVHCLCFLEKDFVMMTKMTMGAVNCRPLDPLKIAMVGHHPHLHQNRE